MLNTLDYIILGLTTFFFILGIIKGFLKQLFSFLGMIIVFTCGSILTPYAQEWLSGVIPDESLRSVVAMVASYLVLFIVWALLTALIIKLLTKIKIIGFLNRVLGGLLGIATIYVICAVVFALVLSTNESFLPTIKNLLNPLINGESPSWIANNMFAAGKNPIGEMIVKAIIDKIGEIMPSTPSETPAALLALGMSMM